MLRRSSWAWALLLLAKSAGAREPSPSGAEQPQPSDETGLHPFTDGTFNGQVRSYFMATQNDAALRDWYSLALGGSLAYHTAPVWGLGMGARLYAVREVVGNSDATDSVTDRPSRYELGLYDVQDPKATEFGLLGEAYVDFLQGPHSAWLGRHRLETPLFNPQDGRMIPTLAQGIGYSGRFESGLNLQAAYVTHVSPRGSDAFFRVDNSLGKYPVGRNTDGTLSDYAGNTDSLGLAIGSLGYEDERLQIHVWDYFAENVFNVMYSDAFVSIPSEPFTWRFGAQYFMSWKVGDGGNPDPSRAFVDQHVARGFGGQIQARTKAKWSVTANYNRITDEGRFLFPREWGREPLFVFQKRERSEGSGDLHAVSFELAKLWDFAARGRLRTQLGYGQYYRPDPTEPALNKYAMPSLWQANLDSTYYFGGALTGLNVEFLVVYKGQLRDSANDNPNFVLNKVDMSHWNVIANYEF